MLNFNVKGDGMNLEKFHAVRMAENALWESITEFGLVSMRGDVEPLLIREIGLRIETLKEAARNEK